MHLSRLLTLAIASLSTTVAMATVVVDLENTTTHEKLGNVTFIDTPYGLLITPGLSHLPPGLHGFHLHALPNCGENGQSAGGHFDRDNTGQHKGPYADGHIGDLPALYVAETGIASLPTLAPRLKEADLNGHALMIHGGGDNYSDQPTALGGGGARLGCGVIVTTKN